MKKLLIIGAVLVTALTLKAQTNVPTFFNSAEEYLTSNNTNFTFKSSKLELETGAMYQNNVNWANSVRAGYNISDYWQLGGQIDNQGIGGVIEEYQGGVAYSIINDNAIKVEAGVDGGYNRLYNSGVIIPRVEFKKLMTTHTYTFIEAGLPIYFRALGSHPSGNIPNAWSPEVSFGAGFTY